MQDTNEQVEKCLISIFNKKSASLPQWELLSDLAKDTERIPVLGAVKFASIVYYAIKDLLKPIGYNHGEFIKRDNKNKTLTLKECFLSVDNTDSTVNEKKIFNPNNLEFPKDVNFSMPDKWELFKDVDLETLNEEQKSIPILKMDNYLIKGTVEQEIKSYLNTKEISENIDKVFLPVINPDFKHLTFEQAIKKFIKESDKNKNELDFNACFKGDEGALFALEIVKQLDAINKIKLPRQSQYLFGVIKGLQSKEVIREEISSDNVYKIFCKKFGLQYTRITRPSNVKHSAFQNAIFDTENLVESLRQESRV
jgi:hypothetical protein